jgi:flavin reductase (DIM6/NTAB) family NADH-FMN oxidoreductase RutF
VGKVQTWRTYKQGLKMERKLIPYTQLHLNAFQAWDEWFLLASGDFSAGKFNAMTISWGSAGIMWGRPFVQVIVRPQRYTYEFMEHYDTFTVSAFPAQYHAALNLLGSKSGRHSDKILESGLTAIAASKVSAPAFAEAGLVLECRKIYFDDYHPAHFLADFILRNYANDYHRIYFGEIIAIQASEAYRL